MNWPYGNLHIWRDEGPSKLDCQIEAVGNRQASLMKFCVNQCVRVGDNRCEECRVGKQLRELMDKKRGLFALYLATESIKSPVLMVDGVRSAEVLHNNTSVTDERGIPAHSVEVIVDGGSDEDIAETLFHCVPAGTGMHGNTGVIHESDVTGMGYAIRFSRPTQKERVR